MSERENLFKIWHTTKHDDFTVTEVENHLGPKGVIDSVIKAGGFWMGRGFVPWHKISYIEYTPAAERQP